MPHSAEGPRWHRYLRFWRSNGIADVDEEIRLHLQAREAELIARGLSSDDARRTASEEFGDIDATRERLYEIRRRVDRRRDRSWWWHQIVADLRSALRGMQRSPGFAAAVIATVALGIGANAAVFSVVDRMLFRPPPLLRDAVRTRRLYIHFPAPDGPRYLEDVVYPRYLDIETSATSVERTALYTQRALAVGVGEDAREMPVGAVSASFFEFFDAPAALGRYFNEQENAPPSGTPVAVLSYGSWQTRYGGRQEVLGEKIRVGPTLYTVIGVAPRAFVGLWPEQAPAVFIPFASFADAYGPPGKHVWMDYKHGLGGMLVHLKPEVRTAAANADLTHALLQSWAKENGRTAKPPKGWYAVTAPVLAERGPMQTTVSRVAMLVGGMGIIVLLIAGANVTNLLLARALRRRREIALRLALGVNRGRLLSQLLVESVLLAVCGGGVGLIAAQWGGSALRAAFLPEGATAPVVTDVRTLVFVAVTIAMVGFASGLAPVFAARRVDVVRHLKFGSPHGASQHSRAREVLLVLQGALSMVLLVGGGLFVRSLANAQHIRLGYDVAPVLVAELNMRGVLVDSAGRVALREQLLATARRAPAIEHAALHFNLPFRGRWVVWFRAPGVDSSALRRANEFYLNAVTPDYFTTMGTRIVRGRGIEAGDGAIAPGVVVVSSAMERLLWPGKNAIGQCVEIEADRACRYVVGVAEDIKNTALSDDAGLYYYLSAAQFNPQAGGLVLRTRGDAASQADLIRRMLQKEMPGASYITVTPFADVVGEQTQSWRIGTTMFVAYGMLALLVAAVGFFSVIAYDVEQHRHEMGVRLALGAEPGQVAWLVVRRGLLLGSAGFIVGGATTLVMSARFAELLFAVSPRDPLVYAVAAAVILSVAAIASFIPARRASHVAPALALQAD
jgi:putative ABC transport system permease protein